MTAKQTHVAVVRQWLQSLGALAAVSLSRQEAEMRMAAFVPMLGDRFPDAAFNHESLEHCAALAVKGFPTYAELAGWLSDWWRAHRPMPTAIAAPEKLTPHEERERDLAAIAASWDDPAGIRERIRRCAGDLLLLRFLAAAVLRYAPQHLGLLPPEIIAALDREEPAGRAPDAAIATLGARYLSPAQLDQINPLPGGVPRHAANDTDDVPPAA